MRKKTSKTANTVAAIRAKHFLYDNPVIFNDFLAIKLTSPFWRFVCKKRWMAVLIFEYIFSDLRPVQISVLCRARFAEDAVNEAIKNGMCNYVILGAGLDSFALRRPDVMSMIHVWELDLADTQANKIGKIKTQKLRIPENLNFIPIDFNWQDLSSKLVAEGFDFHSKSLISLLGFSYYLDKDSLSRIILSIASSFCSGTELIVDIRVSKSLINNNYIHRYKKTERFTAIQGEKMITEFEPKEFCNYICQCGFNLCDSVSPEEQKKRYIDIHSNSLSPSPEVYFFRFKLN
ncbi:class I SAM-dependent methyltransferase [Enterobacter bugandensis]